jgi:hypothetical protein
MSDMVEGSLDEGADAEIAGDSPAIEQAGEFESEIIVGAA